MSELLLKANVCKANIKLANNSLSGLLKLRLNDFYTSKKYENDFLIKFTRWITDSMSKNLVSSVKHWIKYHWRFLFKFYKIVIISYFSLYIEKGYVFEIFNFVLRYVYLFGFYYQKSLENQSVRKEPCIDLLGRLVDKTWPIKVVVNWIPLPYEASWRSRSFYTQPTNTDVPLISRVQIGSTLTRHRASIGLTARKTIPKSLLRPLFVPELSLCVYASIAACTCVVESCTSSVFNC